MKDVLNGYGAHSWAYICIKWTAKEMLCRRHVSIKGWRRLNSAIHKSIKSAAEAFGESALSLRTNTAQFMDH